MTNAAADYLRTVAATASAAGQAGFARLFAERAERAEEVRMPDPPNGWLVQQRISIGGIP